MKDMTQGGLGAHVMITGTTGFIGGNLAGVFLGHGDYVFILVRPGSGHGDALPAHDNLATMEYDLDYTPDCIPAIGRTDTFLHLAWGRVDREEADSPKVRARNVSGSLDCVGIAARLDCTVFMDAGSRVEYGVMEGMIQEDVEYHPMNQYGEAKLEFYQKAAPLYGELNMNYYHLRFFSVYGYEGHPWSIISTLVRNLRQNKQVSLSACRHQWNFIYIEDAVQAVYKLYRHDAPPVDLKSCIMNITSSDTRPLRSFVEEIHRIADFRGELEYDTFVQAKGGALSMRPDIGRLFGLTGGDWKEEYTFCRDVEKTIGKEEANRGHEGDQHIDSLL